MAAKAMENAALIATQNMKDYASAAKFYKTASDFFVAYGSPDKGIQKTKSD